MDYGFQLTDEEVKAYEEFVHQYKNVLDKRNGRWDGMEQNQFEQRTSKLKRFIRKGVPQHLRAHVWMIVSGAQRRLDHQPGLYKTLIDKVSDNDSLAETIRLDLRRTFPENIYFKDLNGDESKLQSLFNVMYAFGTKNFSVGYCQGLNYVTGLMLLVIKDEEQTFWLLDTLVKVILPGYYLPDMISFQTECEVLSQLCEEKIPKVHSLLVRNNIHYSMVTIKWFICLYADVLPVETVYRIWDVLFFEGTKVLFRVALTLIKMHEDQLLKCEDLPAIIKAFQQMVHDEKVLHCHSFIPLIFKHPDPLPMKKIDTLRRQAKQALGQT